MSQALPQAFFTYQLISPYRLGTATVTILDIVNMRHTEDKNLDPVHLEGREVAEMQSEIVCPPRQRS